jgi:hypothetical protein
MFPLLGKTISRAWPLLLGAWILLLVVGRFVAPGWDDVTQAGDVSFLPEDAPSRRGDQLFKQAFPDGYSGSSVVLVLSREEVAGLREQDKKFLEQDLTPELKKMAGQDDTAAGAPRRRTHPRAGRPGDRGAAPESGQAGGPRRRGADHLISQPR